MAYGDVISLIKNCLDARKYSSSSEGVPSDTENIPMVLSFLDHRLHKQGDSRTSLLGRTKGVMEHHSAEKQRRRRRSTDHREQGNQHYGKNKFAEALKHFKRAINMDPTNPKFYRYLGKSFLAYSLLILTPSFLHTVRP